MKKSLILVLIGSILVLNAPAYAGGGGGGMTGGATEATQLMNNTELVAMVAKQSDSVAESLKQTLLQGQQYMAQIKSMLPADQMREALAPYQQTYSDMGKLYNSTVSLMRSSSQVQSYLSQNQREMSALGMNPRQYLEWAVQQSKNRQSTYSTKLKDEIAALNDFQVRAQNLRKVQDGIPGVEGQIQGLQVLNQTTAMATSEMMGLRALIQQQQLAATEKGQRDAVDDDLRFQSLQNHQKSTEQDVEAFSKFKNGKGW